MANSANRGFFRAALDAMIEARTRQVSRYVDNALLMLDDETLKAHGTTRAQIRSRNHFTSMI